MGDTTTFAALALVFAVSAASAVYAVSDDNLGSVSQSITLEPIAFLHHPVNVGLTTFGIILSYRPNDSSTILAKLDTNGTVEPYAKTVSGVQEVYITQASSNGGFHSGDLFLCSGDSIYRITSGADTAQLFATPSKGSTVEHISFDTSGAWGYPLFAVTGDGGVWTVNSTGGSKLVTNLGNNLMPEDAIVAPKGFGDFTGDLLVTLENSHNLMAIPRNATATHLTLAFFPNQAPERILKVIDGRDLLVAKYDLGIIVRIPSQFFVANGVSLLVITEGENGQTGSISALTATGINVTVTAMLIDPSSPHFEGATFVPRGYVTINSITTNSASTNTTTNSPPNGLALATGGVLALAVGGLLAFAYFRRNRQAKGLSG